MHSETIDVSYYSTKHYNATENFLRTKAYNMHDIGIGLSRLLKSTLYFDEDRLFLKNEEIIEAAKFGLLAFGASTKRPLTNDYIIKAIYDRDDNYLFELADTKPMSIVIYPYSILHTMQSLAGYNFNSAKLLMLSTFKNSISIASREKFRELGVDITHPVNLFIVESFAAVASDVIALLTGAFENFEYMMEFSRTEIRNIRIYDDMDVIASIWILAQLKEKGASNLDIDWSLVVDEALIYGYWYFTMEYNATGNLTQLFDDAFNIIKSKQSAEEFIDRYKTLNRDYKVPIGTSIRK